MEVETEREGFVEEVGDDFPRVEGRGWIFPDCFGALDSRYLEDRRSEQLLAYQFEAGRRESKQTNSSRLLLVCGQNDARDVSSSELVSLESSNTGFGNLFSYRDVHLEERSDLSISLERRTRGRKRRTHRRSSPQIAIDLLLPHKRDEVRIRLPFVVSGGRKRNHQWDSSS